MPLNFKKRTTRRNVTYNPQKHARFTIFTTSGHLFCCLPMHNGSGLSSFPYRIPYFGLILSGFFFLVSSFSRVPVLMFCASMCNLYIYTVLPSFQSRLINYTHTKRYVGMRNDALFCRPLRLLAFNPYFLLATEGYFFFIVVTESSNENDVTFPLATQCNAALLQYKIYVPCRM